jgi:predicted transcriptional regulator
MPSLPGLRMKPVNHLPTSHGYRDRIYIIKDVILSLVEYGHLNQTSLIRFCGLNLKKHRSILDELELNAFISRSESSIGHRSITIYRPTQKGIVFCNKIIVPYEKCFQGIKSSTLRSLRETWNQEIVKSERTRIEVIGLSIRSHRNNKVLATLIDHRVFWSCI